MKSNRQGKIILALSIPMAVLTAFASCTGLFLKDFYAKETANWQVQSSVQDLFDLVVLVPILCVAAVFAYKQSKNALIIWGGVVIYFLYTFLIYGFSVHFNQLFLVYCFILGLSVYAVLYFLFLQVREPAIVDMNSSFLLRFCGIYFIVISALFYFLWLSEIVPAIMGNVTPQGLIEAGLLTNPVHVIDLSFFLPVVLLTGILALKRKSFALTLLPALLAFFILMDVSIAWMMITMKQRGMDASVGIIIAMGVLAVLSLGLLIGYLKNVKHKATA